MLIGSGLGGSEELAAIISRVATLAREGGSSPSALRRAAKTVEREFPACSWSYGEGSVTIRVGFDRLGYVHSRQSRRAGTYLYVIEAFPPQEREAELAQPTKVSWRILPPGEHSSEALVQHFEALCEEQPSLNWDMARIKKMISLGPSTTCLGEEEWAGYVVFLFNGAKVALLECPRKGNAIYVIPAQEWRTLSRLTKADLRGRGMERIFHSGLWFERVKARLRGGSGPQRE